MKYVNRFVILLLVMLCAPLESKAAEVTIHEDMPDKYSMVIEGVIVPGDYAKIYEKLMEFGPSVTRVFLYSPGGDVNEAIKIAELLRTLKFETHIPAFNSEINRAIDDLEYFERCPPWPGMYGPNDPDNCICASACTILWAAGIERHFGLLRVHRPRISEQAFARLDPAEAELAYEELTSKVQQTLENYGFPDEGIQKMYSVPSNSAKKYRPFGIPKIVPYFDELLIARCSSMDKSKMFDLELREKRNQASELELDELRQLRILNEEIETCRIIQTMQIRWQGFSEFFGVDYIEKLRRKRGVVE